MTTPHDIDLLHLKRTIRQLLASVAHGDGGEEQSQDVVTAINRLSEQLKDEGAADTDGFDDAAAQLKSMLAAAQDLSGDEVGKVLHALVDLSAGTERPASLEDLANWFEDTLGPVLNRHLGVPSHADQTSAIRDGARNVIDAALQARGIEKPAVGPQPETAFAGMARHHLFWQNFTAMAPALGPLLAMPGGTAAAENQVSALLRTLDLPHEVSLSLTAQGPQLDFAAPADAAAGQTLQIILADAPELEGWTFSTGGHAI